MSMKISGAQTVTFGPFKFDKYRRLLSKDGRDLHLRSRESDILLCLIEHAGQIVSKEVLIERVWPNSTVSEGNLRVQIASLRRLMEDSASGRSYIVGIPGRGYSFREILVEDLELGPDLDSSARRVATPRHNLPVRLKPIIGRTDILTRLVDSLPLQRLVTIVGAGGLGKTTVAMNVGASLIDVYEDGIRLVELTRVADPKLVAGAVAASVHLSLVSDQPLDELVRFLEHKHLLFILDNCEHLVGAVAELVEYILRRVQNVHFLTTSREPLRTGDEWLFRLGPLDLPPRLSTLSMSDIMAFPAVELFLERAQQGDQTFEMDEDSVRAIADICQRLDGNPLAIELAAARVSVFGIHGLSERLNKSFSLLTQGRRTAMPRHQTLSATLDWSYNLLTPQQRTILNRLSLFRGELSLAAGCEVVSDESLDEAAVIEGIAELAAKSLVMVDVSRNPARYRLLFLTRDYAREKLEESGEARRFVERHAVTCLRVLREPTLQDRDVAELGWMDDFRAALAWGFSTGGDLQTGMELTLASVALALRLSLFNEYARQIDQALARASDLVPRQIALEIRLLIDRIHILQHTAGNLRDMNALIEEVHQRSHLLLDTEGDERARMDVYGLVFDLQYFGAGNWPEALINAEKMEAVSVRGGGVPGVTASVECIKAASLYFMGDSVTAIQHISRVLTYPADIVRAGQSIQTTRISPDIGLRILKARILWSQGEAEKATELVREAISLASHARGHLLCHVLAYGAIPVAFWRGDFVAAREHIATLRDQSHAHSLDYWAGWASAFEYVLALHEGDGGASSTLAALSLVAVQIDVLATLHPALAGTEAQARVETGKVGWCAAEVKRAHAVRQLSLKQMTNDDAELFFRHSLELSRQQNTPAWELRAATSLANLWIEQGRCSDALNVLKGVCDRFTEGLQDADVVKARTLIEAL